MANSRSNIYPVQLQGAELNLNKFDAEIKQYSGFNKNNSPFVGGCLSNLFTKTEENTTGSSDSVYVDDNGDVYEAKINGLYKNGELVLAQTDSASAINIYAADYPEETIDYQFNYNTNIETFYYVTQDNRFSYVRRCKRNVETGEVISDQLVASGALKTDDDYIFVKTYVSSQDNSKYEAFKTVWYNDVLNKYRIRITGCIDDSYSSSQTYLVDEVNYIDCPCKCAVYSEPYLVVVPNIIGVNTVLYHKGSNIWETVTPSILNETGYTLASQNIGDYISIGNSRSFLIKANGVVINNTAKTLVLETTVTFQPYNNSIRAVFWSNPYVITQPLSYTTSATVNISLGTVESRYIFSHAGVCYALKTSDNKNFWGVFEDDLREGSNINNKVTSSVTLREDIQGNKHPMLEMGCKISEMVLANNGYVSGIKAYFSETLLTEWNTLNKDHIFYFDTQNDRNILYRDETTKKYYKIVYDDKVRLKYINGLLVVNWDADKNCYRISNGKVLHFAPSWNNRAPRGNIFTFPNAVTDNEYYLASSVNEYNLKDNASILLNPIPVITDVLKVIDNTKISEVSGFDAKLDPLVYCCNFYSGSDSEILYKGTTDSMCTMFVCNNNLKGLPFPINTNGNVQLSPSLFCESKSFGNDVFIKEGSNAYQLIKDGTESVLSYFLGTLIENLENVFILQGQYYAIINSQIFNIQFSGGVVQNISFVVSVENLQFCGNSVYQAYFFSKTNRCLYTFTGANILSQTQLIDKISEVYSYKYNQSTQSIILITDIGTIIASNLGMYLLEDFIPDDVFFYDKGVVFVSDSELKYLQYYESDGFEKHNIEVETCFYGMNNETVTINDCLYLRLFSEEHEEGEVKISATTISLQGRKTENTVFRFRASDWDKLTHSVYVRYQPKEQRGLGISFSIDSPFKIASMSVGSKADAILIDKVSKGAINVPQQTSNNVEW